jgi:hypothetical protein
MGNSCTPPVIGGWMHIVRTLKRAGVHVIQAGESIETGAEECHQDIGLGEPNKLVMADHQFNHDYHI